MRGRAIFPLLTLCFALSACGHSAATPPPAAQLPPPIETDADLARFESWLEDFKYEARKEGIREDVLEQAFDGITPLPDVITLDRKQPETTITLEQYMSRTVTCSTASTRAGR